MSLPLNMIRALGLLGVLWAPRDADVGENLEECYGGSAGLSLHTDCSGNVYLVSMNGSHGGGSDDQWVQVHRVAQDAVGKVMLEFAMFQSDDTGLIATNNPAFRWAGGSFISKAGRPVLFNTERRTKEGDWDYINGDLYYAAPPASLMRGGESVGTPARAPIPRPPSPQPVSEENTPSRARR